MRSPTQLLHTLLVFGLLSLAESVVANTPVNQDIPPRQQNSPSIALDQNSGNLIVAYVDDLFSLNGIGTSYRTISGGPWLDSATQIPSVHGVEVDPSVGSDGTGFVYACMASYDGLPATNSGIYVSASTDGGVNFPAPTPVVLQSGPPGSVPFVIKPKLEVDEFLTSPFRGNVYVIYEEDQVNGRNSNVMFTRSLPGGGSWITPVPVNDTPGTDIVLWPDAAVAANGTVYGAWLDTPFWAQQQGFQGRILTDSSPNAGATWGSDVSATTFWTVPAMLTDSNGTPTYAATSYPSIEADPSNPNRICIAYAARPGSGPTNEVRLDTGDPGGASDTGVPNPFYAGSRVAADNGWAHVVWDDLRLSRRELYYQRTSTANPIWTGPETSLSTSLPPNQHSAVMSPVVVATGGRVHAAWTEPYVDISNWVYVTSSFDDGQIWATPIGLDSSNEACANVEVGTSGANVCVAWEALVTPTVEQYIRVNYSTDSGVTWGGERGVSSLGAYCWNHDIYSDGNNVYLVWAQGVQASWSHIYFSRSNDSGQNWSLPIQIDSNPSGTTPAFAPKICASGTNVSVIWVDQRRGIKDIYTAYSSSGGASWGLDGPLNNTAAAGDCHFPQLTGNGGNAHAVYERNGDILLNSSFSGGAVWQGELRLNAGSPVGSGGASYGQVAASGSQLYVTWQDSRNGSWDIYGTHSRDSGSTWPNADYRIDVGDSPGASTAELPHLAADQNGAFYQWEDQRNGLRDVFANTFAIGADEADIFYVESLDRGATWSQRLRVNDDNTTNDQSHPWLDIKPNGIVDIVWKDKRLDLFDRNYDVYLANLLPGAGTFGPNTRVTTQTLPFPPTGWVGDYSWIDVDASLAHMVWTDTRSPADAALGDIYYDAVTNPLLPVGACCFPSEECVLATLEDCAAAGGDFLGEEVPCEPNPCILLPDWEDHDVGDCRFTVTDQGILGFVDASQSEGSGFVYPIDGTNQLYIGGLWVGLAPDYIANRDYDLDPEREWVVSIHPDGRCRVYEDRVADQDILAGYTDAGASVARGLYVGQESWAWSGPGGADDFVIINYTIENTSEDWYSDIYAGVFLDFDLGTEAADDIGFVEPTERLIYMGDPSGLHVGLAVLESADDPVPIANLTLIHNPTHVWPEEYILDADKHAFLTAADPEHVVLESPEPNDYSLLASVGPLSLSPHEVRTVFFAVIGGMSRALVEESARAAQLVFENGGVTSVWEKSSDIPRARLLSSLPNPLSSTTLIRFETPRGQDVRLDVYDASGRHVRSLAHGMRSAGRHFVSWDCQNESGDPVADGVYFLRLSADDQSSSQTLIVLR